jgi:hypothetical protein
LSHEQSQNSALHLSLANKEKEVERLTNELARLKRNSNKSEPDYKQSSSQFGKFFVNAGKMQSFGDLAATPTSNFL